MSATLFPGKINPDVNLGGNLLGTVIPYVDRQRKLEVSNSNLIDGYF
jgi:hypothetical protein